MTLRHYLPQDTQEAFKRKNYTCDNLSLLLDRYYGYEDDPKLQKSERGDFYKSIKHPFNQKLVEANYKRWQKQSDFLQAKTFKAYPEWRMVVGLGQASILETSMALDRITGIPIIPGSALKGLTASYAMLCHLQTTERKEAEKDPAYKSIFGTQEEAGKVIFLDAVPTKSPELKPDIMNNHYQEYYSDKSGTVAPSPWQNPVPVYFLTLGQNSEFAFAVAARHNHPLTEALVNQAKGWLQSGLSEMGIGAKTAAGYGYMEINEN